MSTVWMICQLIIGLGTLVAMSMTVYYTRKRTKPEVIAVRREEGEGVVATDTFIFNDGVQVTRNLLSGQLTVDDQEINMSHSSYKKYINMIYPQSKTKRITP